MKIVLDSGGNVVKLLRGDGINRGQHRSKPIEVEWEKGQAPYELDVIDKENLVVQVCITRPDGALSGWQDMVDRKSNGIYVYPLQVWDTAVSGDAKVSIQWYDYTLAENEEDLIVNIVDEVHFVIANGIIAQPAPISTENYNIFVHEILKTLATKFELSKVKEQIYELNIEGVADLGSLQQRTYEQDNEFNPQANGLGSSAFGTGTVSNNENEASFGQFNKSNGNTLWSVGNGTDEENRKNAFEVLIDGRAKVQAAPQEDDDVLRYIDLKELTKAQWDLFNICNGEGEYSIVQKTDDNSNTADGRNDATFGSGNINQGDKCIISGTRNEIRKVEGQNAPNSCDVSGQLNIIEGDVAATSVRGKNNKVFTGANYATVSGDGNTVTKPSSTTSGTNNKNHSFRSNVTGTNNTIYGSRNGVIGENNIVGDETDGDGNGAGYDSLTVGASNKNRGRDNIVVGIGNEIIKPTQASYNASSCLGKNLRIEHSVNPQTVVGKYNRYDKNLLFSVGNGTSEDKRSNAFEVYSDGRIKIYHTPVSPEDITPKSYVDKLFGNVTPEMLNRLEIVANWFEEDSSGTSALFKNVEDNTESIRALETTVADIATTDDINALFV